MLRLTPHPSKTGLACCCSCVLRSLLAARIRDQALHSSWDLELQLADDLSVPPLARGGAFCEAGTVPDK